MLSSPARHVLPLPDVTSASSPRGGTLARLQQIQPGHFPYPSRSSPVAPCSVILTRDARSPRAGGLTHEGANRAACMGEGEAFSGPLPTPSLHFREAAQKLGAHDSNRDQARASLGLGRGAAGHVQRIPPRSPLLQRNHIAHSEPPCCEANSIGAAILRGGQVIRAERNGQNG